jgi:3-isopropylmalate/(R)-2-methylmalate dehydratase small subunit
MNEKDRIDANRSGESEKGMTSVIQGKVYVVGDDIDTDQIIPAQYLALVPTIREECMKLGGYAMCGLPRDLYPTRLVEPDRAPSDYAVVIAGKNFGCGSSREHAPIALGAAGVRAVVARSFARIFFRNCIATGELYPIECAELPSDAFKTGDPIRIDLDGDAIEAPATGRRFVIPPLGEVKSVVASGGLFEYARREGLVGRSGGAR